MKRITLIFILLSGMFCQAQLATKEIHDKVSQLIVKEYNIQNYKAIYKLLDKEFQKNISQKELADFLKFNVYDQYNVINSISYLEFKNNTHIYAAECKNGKVDLQLTCNLSEKITGMQWVPHKDVIFEISPLKTEVINSDNPKANSWDLKVDSVVNVFMRNPINTGLSLAIIKDNTIQFYNYGEIEKGSHRLPSNTTIYEIGSVSKAFTGVLFAHSINNKVVNANDPIKKHLGDTYSNLAYRGKPIELIHLANHSSRLPRIPADLITSPGFNALNPYAAYSKEMVLKSISLVKPDTFPGVKCDYSNLGMGLLGIVMETVYKKTYESLIDSFISTPLQMKDTKINLSEEQSKRFAKGYNSDGNETPHWDIVSLAGAGGIRSTSSDMIKFVKANLEESHPALKLSHYSTINDGRNNIAMAWHLFTTKKGNEMIWHNGMTGGFSSFCGFIKSKNVGVVVLSNTANPCDQVALGILKLLQ